MRFFSRKEKSFYENGNIKEKYGVNGEGKKDGEYISYYESGDVKEKYYYVNGIIDGYYVSYYGSGQVNEFCKYVNGKKEGRFVKYQWNFANYNYIDYECYYFNGILIGPYTDYYDSTLSFDKKDIIKSIYNYNIGKLDGKYVGYYKSGAIKDEGFYVDGKMQGQYVSYHENGKLSCVYNLLDGKVIDGEYIWYHKNGQMARKCNYKNGKLVGKYIEYDEDGGLLFEGDFTEGKCVIYDKMADGKRYLRDISDGGHIGFGLEKLDKDEYQLRILREIQTNHSLINDTYFGRDPMKDKIG